jgi:hypothetical protein
MRSLSVTIALLVMLVSGTVFASREYQVAFIPVAVTVADGYLQIDMPQAHTIETCSADDNRVVYPDSGKYFKSFFALAMVSLTTGKNLKVAVDAPCAIDNSWPQISVMRLEH